MSTGSAEAHCPGGEGVLSGDQRIGVVTAAAYGFITGKILAWAYLDPDQATPDTQVEATVLGEPRPAKVLVEAVWDPKHERARS